MKMADWFEPLKIIEIIRAELGGAGVGRQGRGELAVGIEQPCRDDTIELIQVGDLQGHGELIWKFVEFATEFPVALLGDLDHLRDAVEDVRIAADDLRANLLSQLPGAAGDDAGQDEQRRSDARPWEPLGAQEPLL